MKMFGMWNRPNATAVHTAHQASGRSPLRMLRRKIPRNSTSSANPTSTAVSATATIRSAPITAQSTAISRGTMARPNRIGGTQRTIDMGSRTESRHIESHRAQ